MLHAGAKRRSVKRSIGKIEMYFVKDERRNKKKSSIKYQAQRIKE